MFQSIAGATSCREEITKSNYRQIPERKEMLARRVKKQAKTSEDAQQWAPTSLSG